jgi:hypothetical protein
MKKKGSWFIDNLGQLILMALALAVGIYMLWAYVLHGGTDSFKSAQTCGVLTGNAGECRETCDPTLELELPDVGCEGITNKCCVRKDENMGDVMLPSGYGGSPVGGLYNFEVVSISFGTKPTACSFDPRDGKVLICPPNNAYTIPVNIGVTNIGTSAITQVFADPVVVINGNGDNIRGPGRYAGTPKQLIRGTTTIQTFTANVRVDANDAKLNYYWNVYPYASCTTTECKSTDTAQSRGIMSMNGDTYLTVKFLS